MTCAPCDAASRVQASCRAIIDSLSPVQVAWVNATRTTVMGLLRSTRSGRSRDPGPSALRGTLAWNVTVGVEHFCGVTASFFRANARVARVNILADGRIGRLRGARRPPDAGHGVHPDPHGPRRPRRRPQPSGHRGDRRAARPRRRPAPRRPAADRPGPVRRARRQPGDRQRRVAGAGRRRHRHVARPRRHRRPARRPPAGSRRATATSPAAHRPASTCRAGRPTPSSCPRSARRSPASPLQMPSADTGAYLASPVVPALEVLLRESWPFAPQRITVVDGALDAISRTLERVAGLRLAGRGRGPRLPAAVRPARPARSRARPRRARPAGHASRRARSGPRRAARASSSCSPAPRTRPA